MQKAKEKILRLSLSKNPVVPSQIVGGGVYAARGC